MIFTGLGSTVLAVLTTTASTTGSTGRTESNAPLPQSRARLGQQAGPSVRTQRPGQATDRLQLAAADRLADPGFVQLNDGGEILVAVAFGLAGLEHAFGHVQHGGGDASAVCQ